MHFIIIASIGYNDDKIAMLVLHVKLRFSVNSRLQISHENAMREFDSCLLLVRPANPTDSPPTDWNEAVNGLS